MQTSYCEIYTPLLELLSLWFTPPNCAAMQAQPQLGKIDDELEVLPWKNSLDKMSLLLAQCPEDVDFR
jgi:hypothetical protein